jgi:hypothetical protein
MGQYYHPANLDKKQYLHPHRFGDGLKLLEFGSSGSGTMMAMAVLLAVGNGRGGGDLHSEDSIIGSWAGDRIAVIGDYADEENDWKDVTKTKAEYDAAYKGVWGEDSDWDDISEDVITALAEDSYVRDQFLDSAAYHEWSESEWYFLFTKEEIQVRRKEQNDKREAERAKENNES